MRRITMRLTPWLTSLTFVFAMVACGGGGGGGGNSPLANGPLVGGGASRASAAMVNVAAQPAAEADIDNGLILTRLDVVIAADATVAQVNDALARISATTIVAMRAGTPAFTVAVPRQASADALVILAATLEAQPGILAALPGRAPLFSVGPPSPADSDANLRYLQNARFPAAWNARRAAGDCANDKITVIVADAFHRPADVLYTNFPTQVPAVQELGSGSAAAGTGGFHGYDVLTTLAAKLDTTAPTGANPFPECLHLKAVQVAGLTPYSITAEIEAALATSGGKTVVNASFGWDACGTPDAAGVHPACTLANLNAPSAHLRAIWAAMQRHSLAPFADRVLVVSTAGNEADKPIAAAYLGTGLAPLGSAFNIAATADGTMSFATDTTKWEPTPSCTVPPCLPSLTATPLQAIQVERTLFTLGAAATTPTANVLVVGSVDNFLLDRSAFSDFGASVLAVGEGVPTLLGVPVNGTSFSAPQVAGLASYLWLLSPELRNRPARDTIAAIKANASNGLVVDGVAIADGLINAYSTVLSLDEPVPVTPSTAKIRLAMLDVAGQVDAGGNVIGDGRFDLTDLQAYRASYLDAVGTPIEPTTRDYSRFDLNGDGFTGGSRTTRMDLDPSGSTRFGAPELNSFNRQFAGVAVTYNELAVTDAKVLCFYATSALYTGTDLAARDELLSELCPAVAVSAQLPNPIAGPQTLTVGVQAPAASGGLLALAPNLLVELSPTCASVSAASGFTDANGQFTATVTPANGCTSLSVRVTVRVDASHPPLARQTVAASIASCGGALGRTIAGDVVHGSNGLPPPTQAQLDALADVTAITGNLRLGSSLESPLAIRLPCLKSIGGHLQVIGHFPVIEIAALETVGRFFKIGYFGSRPGEPELLFPVLRRVGGDPNAPGIDIAGDRWLTRVDMAALEFVGGGIANDPTSPLVVIRSTAGLTVTIGPAIPPSRIQINGP
jgi:hypothetical protein